MKDTLGQGYLDSIEAIFKFAFSWLIVLPAAVILSGKLLSPPIRLSTTTPQRLKIPLKIFVLEATGGEVIVGMTAILITVFFSTVVFGGREVYDFVKVQFGIDPGQFHAIFFFSALITVVWSVVIFLIHLVVSQFDWSSFVRDKGVYDARIKELEIRGRDKV